MNKTLNYFIYYALVLFLFPSSVSADFGGDCCDGGGYVSGRHMTEGNHHWADSMIGYGWMSFFITWALFIFLVSFIFFYFVKTKKHPNGKDKEGIVNGGSKSFIDNRKEDSGDLDSILKSRLAKGEISQDEYKKIKKEIEE